MSEHNHIVVSGMKNDFMNSNQVTNTVRFYLMQRSNCVFFFFGRRFVLE